VRADGIGAICAGAQEVIDDRQGCRQDERFSRAKRLVSPTAGMGRGSGGKDTLDSIDKTETSEASWTRRCAVEAVSNFALLGAPLEAPSVRAPEAMPSL
jgi:hypothetical protein